MLTRRFFAGFSCPTALLPLAICLFASTFAVADQFTLDAPASGVPGAEISVTWSGAAERYDRITVVAASAADDAKALTSATVNPARADVRLKLPDAEGEFELRYVRRTGGVSEARHRIRLEDLPTSLSAVTEAVIGNTIDVTFTGSGNRYDRIELWMAKGTKAEAALGISGSRTTLPFKLPERAGEFELRYVTRDNKRILATQPLTIREVETRIEAPRNADLGAKLSIGWVGPGNNYDRIELWPSDAGTNKPAAVAAILSARNPLVMTLPEQPGAYELRYVTARENHVLARSLLSVGAVEADLAASDTTLADAPLWVNWQGPGNNYDRIELTTPNATQTDKALAVGAILSGRNPVLINVPEGLAGEFELRYVLARSGEVIATRDIAIRPAGRLAVRWERATERTGTPSGSALAVILDASGSMLQRTESGERRIEIAKRVLTELIDEELTPGQAFALRVFGHREADSCRTDLEIPLGPLDPEPAIETVSAINAMNLAKTPIAASLEAVARDLASATAGRNVILITDGEETCDGDTEATIRALRTRGLNLALSVVSFGITDDELKQTFANWAELGGGAYFDTDSADALASSLRSVVSGPFQAKDSSGEVVAEGVIGGSEVVLPAGVYALQRPNGALLKDEVVVEPDKTTSVAL